MDPGLVIDDIVFCLLGIIGENVDMDPGLGIDESADMAFCLPGKPGLVIEETTDATFSTLRNRKKKYTPIPISTISTVTITTAMTPPLSFFLEWVRVGFLA